MLSFCKTIVLTKTGRWSEVGFQSVPLFKDRFKYVSPFLSVEMKTCSRSRSNLVAFRRDSILVASETSAVVRAASVFVSA